MTSSFAPERLVFDLPAGAMAGWRWGDPGRPTDILFLHATGFNARAYDTLLSPLKERFHVAAPDFRGHGRTTLPARTFGYASWNRHRDDIIDLIEKVLQAPVTLAGHSMGAVVALLVAGKRPDLVRGVAMIEPVILSPTAYRLAQTPGAPWIMGFGGIQRAAARRRKSFASIEEARTALTGRGVFRAFSAEQLDFYLLDGLIETQDGVSLACAPRYESRTYAAQRHNPWAALLRAPAPLVCLRAEQRSTLSISAAQRLTALRPEIRMATVEGATHMLPFERPDRARSAIEAAAVMANRSFGDLT
jgi:pimeloyl-ACP methyl ester carboxylesterase